MCRGAWRRCRRAQSPARNAVAGLISCSRQRASLRSCCPSLCVRVRARQDNVRRRRDRQLTRHSATRTSETLDRRANENDARLLARDGKVGVLRHEAVTWMHGVALVVERNLHELGNVEKRRRFARFTDVDRLVHQVEVRRVTGGFMNNIPKQTTSSRMSAQIHSDKQTGLQTDRRRRKCPRTAATLRGKRWRFEPRSRLMANIRFQLRESPHRRQRASEQQKNK